MEVNRVENNEKMSAAELLAVLLPGLSCRTKEMTQPLWAKRVIGTEPGWLS
jgi:hypothetical protein